MFRWGAILVVLAGLASSLPAAAVATTGTIRGEVTATTGGSTVGTFVTAYGVTADSTPATETTVAGALGRYDLTGLAPGAYIVIFEPPDDSARLAAEWWNGTRDWWEYELVWVTAGAFTSDIDATLEVGIWITGRVTTAVDGKPVVGAAVTATDPVGLWQRTATTNWEGIYNLRGLPGGSYQLHFDANEGQHPPAHAWYPGSHLPSGAEPIAVGYGEQVTVDADLEPGGAIAGMVTGFMNTTGYVFDRDAVAIEAREGAGDYRVRGLPPGEYRVGFFDPKEGYIEGWAGGAPSLARTEPVHVVAGETAAALTGTLREVACDRPPPRAFPDVPTNHPFCYSINWLDLAEVATGYADGSFRPTSSITRQSIAAFLHRYPTDEIWPTPSVSPFKDVSTTHTFAAEIDWLTTTGIADGYEDGTYRPTAAMTRQALSAFLYRLAGEPDVELPPFQRFTDVPSSHPFHREIMWMWWNGLADGYGDATFRPDVVVTRQAFAAMLYRFDIYEGGASLGVDPRDQEDHVVGETARSVPVRLREGELPPDPARRRPMVEDISPPMGPIVPGQRTSPDPGMQIAARWVSLAVTDAGQVP